MKSSFVTLLISLCAGLLVCALWALGVLAPVEAAFVRAGGSEVAAPQSWISALLILSAGLISGFAVERAGARRALIYIARYCFLGC
jgi:hypothetical protein